MSYERCLHDKDAPTETLERLPPSQGGHGRHKCAACAWQLARIEFFDGSTRSSTPTQCSHGRLAPKHLVESLPDNQGGSGRHKCVVCAYQEGRAFARHRPLEEAWATETASEGWLLLAGADDQAEISTAIDEMDAKRIGDMGELIAIAYEKNMLDSAGLSQYADKVEHVAVTIGPAAGYDVRSYSRAGEQKHIEVKTTLGPCEAPFFITENEKSFLVTIILTPITFTDCITWMKRPRPPESRSLPALQLKISNSALCNMWQETGQKHDRT